ncbi:hypothetical protein BAUCODRAFT_41570, partial [Baudoinia panamericana UAMH 10762]
PPEPPSVQWTRRLIIVAFWVVVACLGLPYWLWTTSTYRAHLPLEVMESWSEGRACSMHFPMYIRLSVHGWSDSMEAELITQVQRRWDAVPETYPLDFRLAFGHYNDSELQRDWSMTVTVKTEPGVQPQAKLQPMSRSLDLLYGYGRSEELRLDALGSFIAEEIRNVFKDERETLSYMLGNSPFAGDQEVLLSTEARADLEARVTRAFSYASTYHLTFSLFTSGASPSTWDIDAALERYMNPLIRALSNISHFTVDTQVQLHASISPSIAGPQFDATTRDWKLQKTDLSGFVNSAEWPLSPSIGSGPTINFVLYVPAPDHSPLVLAETGGTSWLIPQWGGVQILNLGSKQSDQLTIGNLEPIMLTFANQLTSLIGLPPSPPSLALRISSLTRERATSLIISASSTLGALARLTLKLTSIAIPNTVAKSVEDTIFHLEQACKDIHVGDFQCALENARIANDQAERAFFEPSMVGQVYFPDEHKVAVYVPLLGPLAVPMVMAALKEIR